MKKKLLLTSLLFLSLSCSVFAAQPQNEVNNAELKQKACQNIFSLVNIDFSFMSPRGTAADVSISDSANTNGEAKKSTGNIEPIANKQPKPCACQTATPQNKTSLFRLDLLHLFKIQIL